MLGCGMVVIVIGVPMSAGMIVIGRMVVLARITLTPLGWIVEQFIQQAFRFFAGHVVMRVIVAPFIAVSGEDLQQSRSRRSGGRCLFASDLANFASALLGTTYRKLNFR